MFEFLKSINDAITEKIFNAIIGKITDLVTTILQGLADGIIQDLNPSSFTSFFDWIGYTETSFNKDLYGKNWFTYTPGQNSAIDLFSAFALIGFVLAIIIFLFNVISIAFGDAVDVKETPTVMVVRFIGALLLVAYSNTIIWLFIRTTSVIWDSMFGTFIATGSSPIGSAGEAIVNGLFNQITAIKVANLIIGIVCGIIIIKRLLAYVVDLISSYILMIFLYMLLPTCAGTFASKKTSVLAPYFRTLISTYVTILTKIALFRFSLLVVANVVVTSFVSTPIMGQIFSTMIIIGFLELGKRCDGVFRSIGLSPAVAAGSLADSFSRGVKGMAANAMMLSHNAKAAKGIARDIGNRVGNKALADGDMKKAARAFNNANFGDQNAGLESFLNAQAKKGANPYQAAARAKETGEFKDAWTNDLEGKAKIGQAMNELGKRDISDVQRKQAINKFAEGYAAVHGGPVPEGAALDKVLRANGINMSNDFKYGKNGYMDPVEEMRNGNKEAESFFKEDSGYNEAVNILNSGYGSPELNAAAFTMAKRAMETMNGGSTMSDKAVADALKLKDPEMLYGKDGIGNRAGADGSISLDKALNSSAPVNERKNAAAYFNGLSMEQKRAAAPKTMENLEKSVNSALAGGPNGKNMANMSAKNVKFNSDGSATVTMQGNGMPEVRANVGADGSVEMLANGSNHKAGEAGTQDTKKWYETRNEARTDMGEGFGPSVKTKSNAIEGADGILSYLNANGVSASDAADRFDIHTNQDPLGNTTLDFHGKEIVDVEKTASGLNFHGENGNVVSFTATERNSGKEITAKSASDAQDVMDAFTTGNYPEILNQAVTVGAIDAEAAFGNGTVKVENISGMQVSDIISGAKVGEYFMDNTYALVSSDEKGNKVITGYVTPITCADDVNNRKGGAIVYDSHNKDAGAYRVYKNDDYARREVSRQRSEI